MADAEIRDNDGVMSCPEPDEDGFYNVNKEQLDSLLADGDQTISDAVIEDKVKIIDQSTEITPAAPADGDVGTPEPTPDAVAPEPTPGEALPESPAIGSEDNTVVDDLDEEIVWKIKKKDLDGIAQNSPQKLIKGKKDADKHIRYLSDEIIPLKESMYMSEKEKREAVEAKLEEANKRLAEFNKSPAKSADPVPEIGDEEYDPFNEEHVNARVKKQVADQVKDLKAVIEDMKKRDDAAQAESVQSAQQKEVKKAVEKEFAEFGSFATSKDTPPEYRLTRNIKEVDRDYMNFIHNVSLLDGTGGGTGQGAMASVHKLMNDKTPTGDALRESCEQRGIVKPDDYETYLNLMEVRKFRSRYDYRDDYGNLSKMPLDEAMLLMKKHNGSLQNEMLNQRLEGEDAHERAVQNRAAAAPTAPNTGGESVTALGGMSKLDKEQLLQTPHHVLFAPGNEVLRDKVYALHDALGVERPQPAGKW